MRKLIVALSVASAFSAVAPAALAVPSASYSFSSCFDGACGSLNGSVGTLTLTQVNNGVSFLFTSASNVLGANSFVGGLYFNGVVGNQFGFNWGGAQTLKGFDYSATANSNKGSAGGYNWDLNFPTGRLKDRLLPGETASWTITGSGVDLADFTSNYKMMVHVQGLAAGDSAKLLAVAAVPELDSYAMFVAGLGLIGAVARRRRSRIGV